MGKIIIAFLAGIILGVFGMYIYATDEMPPSADAPRIALENALNAKLAGNCAVAISYGLEKCPSSALSYIVGPISGSGAKFYASATLHFGSNSDRVAHYELTRSGANWKILESGY